MKIGWTNKIIHITWFRHSFRVHAVSFRCGIIAIIFIRISHNCNWCFCWEPGFDEFTLFFIAVAGIIFWTTFRFCETLDIILFKQFNANEQKLILDSFYCSVIARIIFWTSAFVTNKLQVCVNIYVCCILVWLLVSYILINFKILSFFYINISILLNLRTKSCFTR